MNPITSTFQWETNEEDEFDADDFECMHQAKIAIENGWSWKYKPKIKEDIKFVSYTLTLKDWVNEKIK